MKTAHEERVRRLPQAPARPPRRQRLGPAPTAPDLRAPIADESSRNVEVLRHSARSRRSLAVTDVLSAAVALVVSVQILGDNGLTPVAIIALPLVILLAKVGGLYERDELVLDKSTLDEAPKLLNAATLYTCWSGWVGITSSAARSATGR